MISGDRFYRDGYEYEYLEAVDADHILVRDVESDDTLTISSFAADARERPRKSSKKTEQQDHKEKQRLLRESVRQAKRKQQAIERVRRKEEAAARREVKRREREAKLAEARSREQNRQQQESEKRRQHKAALQKIGQYAKKLRKRRRLTKSSQDSDETRAGLEQTKHALEATLAEPNVSRQLQKTLELLNFVEHRLAEVGSQAGRHDWRVLRKRLEILRERLVADVAKLGPADRHSAP